jgi:hypothetical protein
MLHITAFPMKQLTTIFILLQISINLSFPTHFSSVKPITKRLDSTWSEITSLKYKSLKSEAFFVSSDYDITVHNNGHFNADQRRQHRLQRLVNHSVTNVSNVNNDLGIPAKRNRYHRKRNIKHHQNQNLNGSFVLGPNFITDFNQHMSIISDAPAILLESSAGTGKTTALAGRIAYLLQSDRVQPQNMVVLSFTRKDASVLKEKALDILYQGNNTLHSHGESEKILISREEMEKCLWSGTIHSFAINILKRYQLNNTPLRIISTREMKNRIRRCLGRINSSSRDVMMLYRVALNDANQSIGALVHRILRCLELWKEAGVLPSPYVNVIDFAGKTKRNGHHPILGNDDFIELAMRLGIPKSSAELALEISSDYQVCV